MSTCTGCGTEAAICRSLVTRGLAGCCGPCALALGGTHREKRGRMAFADWQRSKGILPWTRVQELGGPTAPRVHMARLAIRISHKAPLLGHSFTALGSAAIGCAIRFAHLVEMAEHHAAVRP